MKYLKILLFVLLLVYFFRYKHSAVVVSQKKKKATDTCSCSWSVLPLKSAEGWRAIMWNCGTAVPLGFLHCCTPIWFVRSYFISILSHDWIHPPTSFLSFRLPSWPPPELDVILRLRGRTHPPSLHASCLCFLTSAWHWSRLLKTSADQMRIKGLAALVVQGLPPSSLSGVRVFVLSGSLSPVHRT